MVCGYLHVFPAAGLRSTSSSQECSVLWLCPIQQQRQHHRTGRFLSPRTLSVSGPRIHRHSPRLCPCFGPRRHNSIDRLCRTRMQVVNCINHRCNSSTSPCWQFYNRSEPVCRTSVWLRCLRGWGGKGIDDGITNQLHPSAVWIREGKLDHGTNYKQWLQLNDAARKFN